TDKIFVENISKFTDIASGNITYAVVDADNHIAKYTRKYRYTDYTSPEFSITSSLVFSQGTSFNILDYITAKDCISGNITNKVKLTSSTIDTKTTGNYQIFLNVTNDLGDSVDLTLPVLVEEKTDMYSSIELSDYMIYVDKGEKLNYEDYILSATGYYGEEINIKNVKIDSDVHINTPGVYTVIYRVTDENNFTGTTMLIVVVKE
ncbi:MAG: immunoglobulin-like domain-containing protein, partial [Eubacterium sp.]